MISLVLTHPAEKGTPSVLHNPLNRRVAIFTGLAFTAIDVKTMLEIAKLAVRIGKVL